MLRMVLVSIERVGRCEFRVQHDIIGALQPRLGQCDFELQDAGHDIRAGIQQRLHLARIGRLVGALGLVLQLPHHDMLDHCRCLAFTVLMLMSWINGNFEKDASVYEEALSISSGLYYSLSKGKGKSMYEKNKKLEEKDETDDGVYRGDLIYSPDVPFFRDEDFDL